MQKLYDLIVAFFDNITKPAVVATKYVTQYKVSKIPKYGDKNSADVGVLQKALVAKGYDLKVDNDFGPLTSKAVIDFKKSIGLYPSNVLAEWVLDKLGIYLKDKNDEPDRDEVVPELPDIDLPISKQPLEIVKVAGTKWQSKGKFQTKSGRPKGLLIHYAVSGNTKAHGINLVKYFANTPKTLGYQLACPFMDKDGILYVAENWKLFDDWNNNAGSSKYKELNGVSKYLLGLEVLCWGRLNGQPDRGLTDSEKRTVKAKDNVVAGTYHKFTEGQEQGILKLIDLMLEECPDFDTVYITGHDEVAPGRKQDPGGSLSMTIPEFRAFVKGKLPEFKKTDMQLKDKK